MTEPAKWHVRPAKTQTSLGIRPVKAQISLGIRPVWSAFAVRMKKAWVLSYPLSTQSRLRSDWADAQADLSLRRAHNQFAGFVIGVAQLVTMSFLEQTQYLYKIWLAIRKKLWEGRLTIYIIYLYHY